MAFWSGKSRDRSGHGQARARWQKHLTLPRQFRRLALEPLEDRRLLADFPLVPSGAAVSYRVPSAGDDPLAWTARDFDDSAWTDTIIADGAGLVITEIDAGDTDWVEIQNVSDRAITTSDWFVAVNDATSGNINDVNPVVWALPAEVVAEEVLYKTDDDGAGNNYFGGDIVWDTDHGWAMIVDGEGTVADFVVWGYTETELGSFNVSAGGFSNIAFDDQWSRESVAMPLDGWHTQNDGDDIGSPTHAGSYTYDSGTGTYTVQGGSDIFSIADHFYYVHQPLIGDGEIIAKVNSVENTNSRAKAGVMIRESLDVGSKHAMIVVTPEKGVVFHRRATTGGSTSFSADGDLFAPYWIKLSRQGDTLTGYRSPDGNSWTEVGSQTISMTTDVHVGLAVTAHDDGALCTAEFESVSVVGSFPSETSLGRTGQFDTNIAGDFAPPTTKTQGTQNPAITVPFGEIFRSTTGVGFSDGQTEFESIIEADVGYAMPGVNASLWSRIEFQAADLSLVDGLTLRVKYDDGFVAYLNGTIVAERNAPPTPQWNSAALAEHPDLDAVVFKDIDISGLPVADSSGRLVGVVSEFDLLELVWDPKSSKDKVHDYMSREIHTVDEGDELTAVAEQFRTRSIRRLPVMRGDQLVGVISRHDLLRDIMRARGQIAPVVPRLLTPVDTHARTTVGI